MLPYERLQACVAAIRQKTDFAPRTALVLGSGLGGFGERLALEAAVDYKDIPGFPVSTVPGHQGRFLFGFVGEEPVVAMQGRVHYYEGYAMEDVVLPIRVMGLLGAKRLVLTNAAGGIGPGLEAGDLMLLTGHIAAFVPSPLIGSNVEELGPRFPDMTEAYSPRLREKALAAARRLGIPLKEGVYLQTTGPQYETPAEIRMFAALGANAVGMSTATWAWRSAVSAASPTWPRGSPARSSPTRRCRRPPTAWPSSSKAWCGSCSPQWKNKKELPRSFQGSFLLGRAGVPLKVPDAPHQKIDHQQEQVQQQAQPQPLH